MKEQQKQIIRIDDFDETVSLWQLLPAGVGEGLKHLKIIVDSIHNSRVEQSKKPLSILISGKQGIRTHARALTRALGLQFIDETPACLLQTPLTAIHELFSPTRYSDSCIISGISLLCSASRKVVYEIITTGRYTIHNYLEKRTQYIPVNKLIIMTTHLLDKVPNYFMEKIDHVVEIEEYTDQQLELVVLQRLKYCQIDYDEEKVMWLIVEYGGKDLHRIIRLLKDAMTIMLADGRNVLTVEDVKKVMAY